MKNRVSRHLVALITAISLIGGTSIFADLNKGLVAHYPFDGNADDTSTYAVHGALYGGVSFVSGVKGQAAHFDGFTGVIQIPPNASRSFYSQCFSVALWFRTTEQDWGFMVDSRAPDQTGYIMEIHENGPGLLWFVESDIQHYGTPAVGPHNNSYQDGKWHLVVGVREPNSTAIYLDGALVERASIPPDLDVGAAQRITVGTRFSPNGAWDYYTGDLDDLRIYNRALSEEEIQAFLDADGDGVPDANDQCPNTATGEVVNAVGCSISQLVPASWPWKNHGEYVSAVAHVAGEFMAEGLITGAQWGEIVSAAARSEVGKRR